MDAAATYIGFLPSKELFFAMSPQARGEAISSDRCTIESSTLYELIRSLSVKGTSDMSGKVAVFRHVSATTSDCSMTWERDTSIDERGPINSSKERKKSALASEGMGRSSENKPLNAAIGQPAEEARPNRPFG